MFRKFSIVGILATVLVLLSPSFCESVKSNELETWKNRAEVRLDPSVISGIRTLEYIRRLIIASLINEAPINSRFLSINKRSFPRNFNGGIKNGEKISNARNSRGQMNSTMFEALSKLANVRVADLNIEENSRNKNHQNSKQKYFDGRFDRRQFPAAAGEKLDLANTPKVKSSNTERPKIFNASNLTPRKFQCHPISEIYLPHVDKQMPAFLCAHGKKAFIISSERFNQESRDRFLVSLDDKTFRLLNPIRSGPAALTSGVSVLPATLVLKRGDSDYSLRGVKPQSASTSTKPPE